jgi:hypothetical protein
LLILDLLRLLTAAVVSAAALLAASAGSSAPIAETRACAPREIAVNIQILGDRTWGWKLGRYTAIPAKVTTIAVWSSGGPAATYGVAAYGWVTRTRASFSSSCTLGRAQGQPTGKLSAPVRVKDGWYFGRKFTCLETGRFVVEIRNVAGGKRLTVRVQRTGKLLAVGEVKAGGGWLRGSPSCRDSSR